MMSMKEGQFAALVLGLISFNGVLCNCFVFVTIRRIPRMANSFGRISAGIAAVEVVTLALFVLYFTPMVFFNIEVLKKESYYCGAFLLGCFQYNVYSHVLLSLNRFCAIYFPLYYGKIFTQKATTIVIILMCLISVFPILFLYLLGSCRFEYFDDYWRFGFAYRETCRTIPFPTNVEAFGTSTLIIAFLDFAAIYRVRVYNKEFGSCHLSKYWSSRRKHDEVNFLKQASSRALLFAMGIIVYYFLPYYFTSRWVKFLFGPVNWVSVLTADGLITIIYSRDLRPAFKNQVSRAPQTVF
ncbi:hypothetical protein V3C99_006915 [Haemonchus contortus]